MLHFWKRTSQRENNAGSSPSKTPPSSPSQVNGLNERLGVNHAEYSGLLAALDDEGLCDVGDADVSSPQSSRLSKSLSEVLTDKGALGYFIQYLEAQGGLSYVRCWLDIESFRSAALSDGLYQHNVVITRDQLEENLDLRLLSPPSSRLDHDSLSVSTDCDSYTADSNSLYDYCSNAPPDFRSSNSLDYSKLLRNDALLRVENAVICDRDVSDTSFRHKVVSKFSANCDRDLPDSTPSIGVSPDAPLGRTSLIGASGGSTALFVAPGSNSILLGTSGGTAPLPGAPGFSTSPLGNLGGSAPLLNDSRPGLRISVGNTSFVEVPTSNIALSGAPGGSSPLHGVPSVSMTISGFSNGITPHFEAPIVSTSSVGTSGVNSPLARAPGTNVSLSGAPANSTSLDGAPIGRTPESNSTPVGVLSDNTSPLEATAGSTHFGGASGGTSLPVGAPGRNTTLLGAPTDSITLSGAQVVRTSPLGVSAGTIPFVGPSGVNSLPAGTSTDSLSLLRAPVGRTSFLGALNSDKKRVSRALVDDALRIFKKYVAQEASTPVCCPEDMRNDIIESICREDGVLDSSCYDRLQKHAFDTLEHKYFNGYTRSHYNCKNQIDILTSGNVVLQDILYNESILFYFMEFLEQEGSGSLLEFWLAATNFRQQISYNPEETQNDAVVLYDKYFSLQAICPLGFGDKIRLLIEENICRENGPLPDCFHQPVRLVEYVLDKNYLRLFLSSQLYFKYLSELISTVQTNGCTNALMRSRRTASDCSSEVSTSLLPVEESVPRRSGRSAKSSTKTDMNIDTRQLYDPDSLWRRRKTRRLSFGRITDLGRFETDVEPEPDRKSESRLTRAMRRLVNLEESKTKEEMAWQVAEMIVKDITSVTLGDLPHTAQS